jgi:hypothetical protein
MSKVQLQGNASGTGVFTIASPNSNTDRTLTLPDNTGTVITTGSTGGVSQAMLGSNVAGNGPSFSAFKPNSAGNQSVTFGTVTLVTFGATLWNQGGGFSTATSRFTPTVAGYYQFSVSLGPQLNIASGSSVNIYVSKNGNTSTQGEYLIYRYFPTSGSNNYVFGTSGMMYLNGTTDYLAVYTDGGNVLASDSSFTGSDRTWFQAFLARSA